MADTNDNLGKILVIGLIIFLIIFVSIALALRTPVTPLDFVKVLNLTATDSVTAGDYYSGDGTKGFTGTCTILGLTSITVKDGLITGCT